MAEPSTSTVISIIKAVKDVWPWCKRKWQAFLAPWRTAALVPLIVERLAELEEGPRRRKTVLFGGVRWAKSKVDTQNRPHCEICYQQTGHLIGMVPKPALDGQGRKLICADVSKTKHAPFGLNGDDFFQGAHRLDIERDGE